MSAMTALYQGNTQSLRENNPMGNFLKFRQNFEFVSVLFFKKSEADVRRGMTASWNHQNYFSHFANVLFFQRLCPTSFVRPLIVDSVRGKPYRSSQGRERGRQSRPGGLDLFGPSRRILDPGRCTSAPACALSIRLS